MDKITPEKRSKIMSNIKSNNTSLELKTRSLLRQLKIGYRLSAKGLPGKPDIVMKGRKCVIFVNGCFWHKHNCWIYRTPKTRVDYWLPKLEKNATRDKNKWNELLDAGWKVIVVWECALRGVEKLPEAQLAKALYNAINGIERFIEIRGASSRIEEIKIPSVFIDKQRSER